MTPDMLELVKLVIQAVIAVSAVAASVYSYRAKQATTDNHAAIQEIKIAIDGRLGELLDLTRDSARAAGVLDEKTAQAERDTATRDGLS